MTIFADGHFDILSLVTEVTNLLRRLYTLLPFVCQRLRLRPSLPISPSRQRFLAMMTAQPRNSRCRRAPNARTTALYAYARYGR